MPGGFNTIPSVGGGGGQPNMTYVGSVHMSTYNRTWAQGGTAGYYAMFSTNQENGYIYFVGSGTTTGVAMNRLAYISHSFTSINIIAPTNDMISLYKGKVKSTTTFNNAFDGFSSFPNIIRSSGNFVLPNNALPLVNVLVVGGGGAAHNHGGGGGGGNAIKLTAFQAVGTTGVTIGANTGANGGVSGGTTYFGNVYALGGGGSSGSSNGNGLSGGNGGGASSHSNSTIWTGGTGITQTSSTGLGTAGTPAFAGGYTGGSARRSDSNHVGGSGAGAGGNGVDTIDARGGKTGGLGHASDITGTNLYYGAGGASADHHANSSSGNANPYYAHTNLGYGQGAYSTYNSHSSSDSGAVIVRYYIP